jgi:hypothetical protein
MNEQELAQYFFVKYTLHTNGLPCGWLGLKPSFVDSKCVGNLSELWKVWHEEGVDVITKCKEHSSNWRASWKPAEVKQFSRLRFIVDLTFFKAKGNMDNIPRVLQELDAEKNRVKLSTVYTRIKKHENMQSPLKA